VKSIKNTKKYLISKKLTADEILSLKNNELLMVVEKIKLLNRSSPA